MSGKDNTFQHKNIVSCLRKITNGNVPLSLTAFKHFHTLTKKKQSPQIIAGELYVIKKEASEIFISRYY